MSCCVFTLSVAACLFLKESDCTSACPWLAHLNCQSVEFSELFTFSYFSALNISIQTASHTLSVQYLLLHDQLPRSATVFVPLAISVLPVSETAASSTFSRQRKLKSFLPA